MSKIKRLFIDSDILQPDELESAQWLVADILEEAGIEFIKKVFDETQDFAWHQADEAWESVKRADEIFGDSSLVPLAGYGTYTGSPVVMDVMMAKALEEKIEGKSMFFLRPHKNIHWDGIDLKLIKKVFGKKNKLFTTEYDEATSTDKFVQVDVKKLKA